MKPGPLCIVLSMLLATLIAGSSRAGEERATAPETDIIIYTAREIITMDSAQPSASAVAVANGRILGVGSRQDMVKLAGDKPHAVDSTFKDKVVLPGLIDQHLHPLLSALTLSSEIISIEDWALPEGTIKAAHDAEEYIARLRAAEAAMDDPKALLLSWGFHHYFHDKLTRNKLDAISTTRPIIVWHRSAHEFFLNTTALQLAGVTSASIGSLEQGVRKQINFEEGHFWERGAFEFLLPSLMPLVASPDRLLAGLALTEKYLHSSGVTTSSEPGGATDMYPVQVSVLGDDKTPFRFYFIPDGRTLGGSFADEKLIAETEKLLPLATGNTEFLPKQVKLFADGAIFSQLMQMRDGYTDGHHGEWMMEPSEFARIFRTYWDAGYQIHVHQNGDAGLEMVLDTLAQNLERNPRTDHRTTIVHFGFATPEQVQRLAKLGAIVSANPYYTVALADRYGEIGIGPKRADEMVRLGDVSRAGVSFSFHSDMPMAPAQPLFLMWAAVNRLTPSGRVAGPEQRISVQQALAAVTTEAAFSLRLEEELGSISPGKRANFTILEESPFAVKPGAIKDIEIWGTVLEGRLQPLGK